MEREEQAAGIVARLFSMVASVELANAAVLEILVENGVIDREILLKGLIERRDGLDPKLPRSGFENLIDKLASKADPRSH